MQVKKNDRPSLMDLVDYVKNITRFCLLTPLFCTASSVSFLHGVEELAACWHYQLLEP